MSPAVAAIDRLLRLLAILPWVASRGGATFAEIADRFGLDPRQVEADLELATLCGRYPLTPDVYLGLEVFDDVVTVQRGELAARPMRLTESDGLRVHAAATTLLRLSGGAGDDPLARAVDKLGHLLGDALHVDPEEPKMLEEIRDAATAGRVVEIEYYALSRDEVTTRRIEPHLVHHHGGHWYVEAIDRSHGEHRRFRVSRVQAVTDTGETFEPRPDAVEAAVFTPSADTQTVVLRLPATARWVVESYPVHDVSERDDGGFDVTLAVAGTPWLERLLLRVGPDAEVLAPDDLRGIGLAAARRVRQRYT